MREVTTKSAGIELLGLLSKIPLSSNTMKVAELLCGQKAVWTRSWQQEASYCLQTASMLSSPPVDEDKNVLVHMRRGTAG